MRGWDECSTLACARAAGMTSRVVTDRFPQLSDLAIAVWRTEVGRALVDSVRQVLRSTFPDHDDPSAESVVESFNALLRPGRNLAIALELIMAAVFDERLAAAISLDLCDGLGPWIAREPDVESRRAAQHAYVLIAALGILIHQRGRDTSTITMSTEIERLMAVLAEPGDKLPLPGDRAPLMGLDPAGPMDAELAELYRATVLEVAHRGYAGATLTRIVARTRTTQGLIYSRFATKADLVAAAIRWRTSYALRHNQRWMVDLAARVGAGLAEATVWRECLRPEHRLGRALHLEQARAGWRVAAISAENAAAEEAFVQSLREANPGLTQVALREHVHWGLGLGLGAALLPTFVPGAWRLPFMVVTSPLLGAQSGQGLEPLLEI